MMTKSEALRAFCRWYQLLPRTPSLDMTVEWFNKVKRMQSKRVDIHLVNDAVSVASQEGNWEDITVEEAERALLLI